MAEKKQIILLEKIQRKVKGIPRSSMKEVKTNGTATGVQQAVDALRKKATTYFEVVDQNKGKKTTYCLTLSGKNYETKTVKV